MPEFFPGLIIGFREGLEAFLIIAIIIRYLQKTNRLSSIKYVWRGAGLGIVLSLVIGGILYLIARGLSDVDPVVKLWESGASVFALILVTTFIIWMIKNGSNMTNDIEGKIKKTISNVGILILTFAFVAREGVEIAIFS
ncbi:MAG: FTR1 family protein, partial [Candidatus Izemoplasmatales bacterium]|nr:FTR1 family protein [Candidatus Izemoplasmatales bacterium]